ncbi:hypothetical protein N7510_010853 [Penicillium lagena]|uniref:uncharacterized protein n=1 Tax=Penicillium lagena TaxID=94218 RepID=UPI002540652C|nr:uncharacterized protein N7510_010853 [Penicillium lagena]KAJ5601319.1 hypothetical protein N7510_010853 [Penicillium lagena]
MDGDLHHATQPTSIQAGQDSVAELRWKYGRRNVLDAASHRGPNHRKSTSGMAGFREGAVSTQFTDGSVWSTEVAFCDANLVRSH